MAFLRLDHTAVGTGDGTSWANAYTSWQAALTGWTSGDIIIMDDGHAESTVGAVTYSGGTIAEPILTIRVDKADDSYSPTNGADTVNIQTTLSNAHITLQSLIVVGVNIEINGRLIGTTGHSYAVNNCYVDFNINNQGIDVGVTNSDISFSYLNTTINGGGGFRLYATGGAEIEFLNCVFTGLISTAGLVTNAGNRYLKALFDNCDFSGVTTAALIMCDTSNWSDAGCLVDFINCKMPTPATSFAWTDGTFGNDNQKVRVIQSDGSGDDLYNLYIENYRGTEEDNNTTYFNSTDAWVDADQSTNLSHELIAKANCRRGKPIRSHPMVEWIDTTGTYSVTVELWDGFTTALQNDEAWLEVSYLDGTTIAMSLSSTQVFDGDTPANLTAGAGAASWTGEPTGRSAKLVASGLTVGRAGFIKAVVCLGKYESGKSLFYNPVMTIA